MDIYRFLIRNRYLKIQTSHIGQKLPENTYNIISHFLSEFYDYGVLNKIQDCVIYNIDGTPVFLNMPFSKTI